MHTGSPSLVTGPAWLARNWASEAGRGSIHDDATAREFGFRGGTVPADVHLNQFPPVLCRIFGDDWFKSGNLSLLYKNATTDGEPVRVFAETPESGDQQCRVWMERDDGLLVCEGTAAVGDHTRSELWTRDLRPCDPSSLEILRDLTPGQSLGCYDIVVPSKRQFSLFDAELISDPLDWYRSVSPWGGAIACPSTIVQQLWGVPIASLERSLGDHVGLFGAIEVGHINGPLFLDREYRIESELVCVGQSPKTEYFWFDSIARSPQGPEVARMRMMCRVLKPEVGTPSET